MEKNYFPHKTFYKKLKLKCRAIFKNSEKTRTQNQKGPAGPRIWNQQVPESGGTDWSLNLGLSGLLKPSDSGT